MNLKSLGASLLSLSLLTTSIALPAQAAAQSPDHTQQQGHRNTPTQQQQSRPAQGHNQTPAQQRPQQTQRAPQQQPAQAQRQQPPKDFAPVHQAFHERRAQIGAGPAVPPGVHIQQGKPLPKGYGKRLDARALHGLPRYDGYEWRRVGTDIVLVAITTGIVYTILQGVLK